MGTFCTFAHFLNAGQLLKERICSSVANSLCFPLYKNKNDEGSKQEVTEVDLLRINEEKNIKVHPCTLISYL